MKVLILATGKTEEHNDSYGARLIEQGRAVAVREDASKTAGRRGKRLTKKTGAEPGASGTDPEMASERSM